LHNDLSHDFLIHDALTHTQQYKNDVASTLMQEELTPLQFACWNNETARAFVDAGVDEHEWTPLFFASRSGNDAGVRILIDAGANVNAVDAGNFTALHHACWCGSETCVRMLVEAGANVNEIGNTLLDVATKRGMTAYAHV
jgi:ankyrin repeat protein